MRVTHIVNHVEINARIRRKKAHHINVPIASSPVQCCETDLHEAICRSAGCNSAFKRHNSSEVQPPRTALREFRSI